MFETTSQNIHDSCQEAAFHVLTVIHGHPHSSNFKKPGVHIKSLWRRYTIPKKDTKSIFDRLNERSVSGGQGDGHGDGHLSHHDVWIEL